MNQRIPCSNCQRKFNCPAWRIKKNPSTVACSRSCAAKLRFKNPRIENIVIEKHGELEIEIVRESGCIKTVHLLDTKKNHINIEMTKSINLFIKEN